MMARDVLARSISGRDDGSSYLPEADADIAALRAVVPGGYAVIRFADGALLGLMTGVDAEAAGITEGDWHMVTVEIPS